MALQLWENVKQSIAAYTGLSPATFFTVLALGLAIYYVVSNFFGSSNDAHVQQRSRGEQMEPLPPPVQVGEITDEELKQYDGSDPKKPLLMAIKGQIYDVSQSRMFYGPGGPYALFAGKDASRALAKMSFEDKDLNGDLTGLGMFELEALQDWEYKFMSKYVKVGTVKKTVPVTDGAAEGEATTSTERDAANPADVADGDTSKPAENSNSVATKSAEVADANAAKPAEVADDTAAKPTEVALADDTAAKPTEVATDDNAAKLAEATDDNAAKPAEVADGNAAEPAEDTKVTAAKPAEDGLLESAAKATEETEHGGDVEKDGSVESAPKETEGTTHGGDSEKTGHPESDAKVTEESTNAGDAEKK